MRRPSSRSSIAAVVAISTATLLVGLFVRAGPAPGAAGVFSLDRLLIGGASGTEDYVFTIDDVIYPDGGVDAGAYYRIVVRDSGNIVRNGAFPCAPAADFTGNDNTYTVRVADPPSTAAPWKFTLEQYAGASCTGTPVKTATKNFNVAKATAYADPALTTTKAVFPAGGAAYLTVQGLPRSVTDWSVTWLLPSSAVACANIAGSDRPDANSDGRLPPKTNPPYLLYRPDPSAGGVWNRESRYETVPCVDLSSTTEGSWKLKLQKDATTFVVLDAFSVDATPPPPPDVTTRPPASTNVTTATFEFSDTEPGVTFACSFDGGAYSACVSPKAYQDVVPGSHTFAVRASDGAGNASAAAASAWIVDTTPPLVTLTIPAPGSTTTSPLPTFVGSGGTAVGDSNTLDVSVYTGTAATGSPVVILGAVVGPDGAYSVTSTQALVEGVYTAQAAQPDAAGNVGRSSANTFTIGAPDTVAPVVTLSTPADGSTISDVQPTFSGLAGTEPGDSTIVLVDLFAGSTATGTPLQTLSATRSDGTWTVTAAGLLVNGTYTAQARQVDEAGNVGRSGANTFAVDASGPAVTIDSHPADPTSSTDASFGFSTSVGGASFECRLDAAAYAACTSPATYGGLQEGPHTFAVRATGAGGNTGVPATFSWIVDTTAPTPTLTSPADGSIGSGVRPTFAGTAGTASGDEATVTIFVYAGSTATGTPVQTTTTTRLSSGSYSVTASAALDAGTYTARAEQMDSAGNVGRSSTTTFTVDTAYRSTVIGDGPAGYWRLGEASGTTAADETGRNPGSYLSGVLLGQPGILSTDTAAFFDGIDDMVSVPASTSLDATTAVTVEAWVKRSKSGAWQNIVSKPGNGATANQNYALWLSTTNQVVFLVGNGTSSLLLYGPTIDTSWHYLAATYDNATAKLYLDGALKTSASSTVKLTPRTGALTVGRSTDSLRIFGGVIDEPAVYMTALSATQIANHFQATSGADTAPPAVTIVSPADGSTTGPTPTFYGAAGNESGDSTTVTVKIYVGSTPSGLPMQTLTTTRTDGTWTTDAAAALADDTYTAQAEQSDASGNLGKSGTATFTVTSTDVTAPVVTLTSPAAGGGVPSGAVTFGGTAGTAPGDLAGITLKIWKGTTPADAPLQTLNTAASGGSWSLVASLDNGVYAARAEQSDQAGNLGLSAPISFTVGTSYRDDVLADHPGGYWRLGETSGATAADETGTSPGTYLNGVLLQQPSGLSSDTNASVTFDGVDDYVSVPNTSALGATAGVTVEAWIKRTRSGAWQNILAKPGNGAAAAQNYALWLNTSNQVVFLFGNGSSSTLVYGPVIDTAWHYLAATYDNATARLYVDGVQQASAASSIKLTPNTQPLLIGRTTDNVRVFGGSIDEPAVYPSALSATRIQAHYARGNAADTVAPVVTLSTPANGSSTLDAIPHFAGQAATTATDSASVTVRIYGGTAATGTPLQTLSAAWAPTGSWSVDAGSALPLGTYTAQAEQTDTAGNVGASAAGTFTVAAPAASADPVFVGAGDIGDCGDTQVAATAGLILGLPSTATVFTLGDNAYPHGSDSDFANCYDPYWGQFKSRTLPSIGDHEYETSNAAGYFSYFQQQLAPFGASATDPNRAYYSYDLGSWHVVVFNSSCGFDAAGCSPTSQAAWIASDLAAHPAGCTLAYDHAPRWSSGSVHGNNATLSPYFSALYDGGAELLLSGNDHLYERFAPQDPQGYHDPVRGVRQMIVGTGGGGLYTFGTIRANSEVRKTATYGVLKLTLHAGSYEWQFIPTAGTFSDSGTATCH